MKKKNPFIKELRQQLGISQEDMAIYLKLNRSRLAMIEAGVRDLPTEILIRLEKLYTVMVDKPGLVEKPSKELNLLLTEQDMQKSEFVRVEISIYQHKLMSARRRLEKLKNDQERGRKLLLRMDDLKSVRDEEDKDLLTLIDQDARKTQKNTNARAELTINMQIVGIESVLKYLQGLL